MLFRSNNKAYYLKCCCIRDSQGFRQKAIQAYELKSNKPIGILCFDYRDDEGFLQRISITDADYYNRGVGGTLLNAFETYMKKVGVKKVYGIYLPNGTGRYITPYFYKNKGYYLENELVCKNLDPTAEQPEEDLENFMIKY